MPTQLHADRWQRFCARHHLESRHLLVLALFLQGHPEQSFIAALLDFVHGRGPAAVATGRAR